jgi:hypothetical protein
MGGGELARYLSTHGCQRISRIVLVISSVPKPDANPQAARAGLDRFRTSYAHWVAENAALPSAKGYPAARYRS